MEARAKSAETRITATELARNLSDILNRARYSRETFIVERNGEEVARIEPPPKIFTVKDFIEFWERVPKPDPGYWDDVEEAHRLMNAPLQDPWES